MRKARTTTSVGSKDYSSRSFGILQKNTIAIDVGAGNNRARSAPRLH